MRNENNPKPAKTKTIKTLLSDGNKSHILISLCNSSLVATCSAFGINVLTSGINCATLNV